MVACLIQNYPEARDRLFRHWPYFKATGFDLFGVGVLNRYCEWPETVPYKEISIGGYVFQNRHLPGKMKDCFEWFMEDRRFAGYSHVCLCESDVIFFKPKPETQQIDAAAILAGHEHPAFLSKHYYHAPWFLSRENADKFVFTARRLLHEGKNERGMPDRFFGLTCDEAGIPIQGIAGAYTRNDIDQPQFMEEAKNALRKGAWVMHGIKRKAQLEELLKL